MAEQSKPNTFTGGMKTDLDPGFQPKDSYFTGLNVRVITNGSNSYSLENIKGPLEKSNLNVSGYRIHGAVIVGDDIITTQKSSSGGTSPTWKIYKNSINSDFSISSPTQLWSGQSLFSYVSGKIEIESVIETENIHRIYCTDGLTGLKSINIKDEDLSSKTVNDFLAFKPNVMHQVELVNYNNTGGNLNYGAYSYTYRLGSEDQSNYTHWAPISRPINIVRNSIATNDGLTVEGELSSFKSTKSLSLEINNLSTEYEIIEIAAIYYPSENVSSIKVIEEGSISSSKYEFIHSGFELEKVVEGGIASAIIDNTTWDVCKSLAQKDNKLFAANLKSQVLDLDLSTYKVKSYKITDSDDSNDTNVTFTAHTEEANPHRFQNGSGGVRIYDNTNYVEDKNHYKFLGKNFGTTTNKFVLGAETPGYSSNSNDGFRVTFDQVGYKIDETATNADYAGAASGDTGERECIPFKVYATENTDTFAGGKKGPHNPAWDTKYRSFKRGEVYRFGIVLYDTKGRPGFTHHIGDVKMPEAMDHNNYSLDSSGNPVINTSTSLNSIEIEAQLPGWKPSTSSNKNVYGWALIPKIEVRLPSTITSKISGYKIVRAELQDNDKTIITQGVLNNCVNQSPDYGNASIRNKHLVEDIPYSVLETDDTGYTNINVNPFRTADNAFTLDTPDVTIGGKSYEFLDQGYDLKLVSPIVMGREWMTENNVSYDQFNSEFTLMSGGGIDVDDGVSDTDESNNNVHSQANLFRYKWMSANDMGLTSDSDDDVVLSRIKNADNNLGLFMQHVGLDYVKSVTNGEQVSTTQSGLNKVFQNSRGEDSWTDFDNQYGSHSLNYLYEKRADFVGNAVSTLFLKTSSGTSSTSAISYKDTFDYVGKSIHRVNVSSNNKYFRAITSKWVAEIVRDTTVNFEQYGGYNDSAISNTRFYDCSSFYEKTTTSFQITGGDTFCDFYTYKNIWPSGETNSGTSPYYNTCVPLESGYNLALRNGIYCGSSKILTQAGEDQYYYNNSYNQESNLLSSVVKPSNWDSNDLFKSKIASSKTKIAGEPQDAWSIFPANDFIELNLSKGEIKDLINFKNQLYCIQDSAVAFLSINSRALIQGEGAAADIQITSGTGTVIERYDYLTDQYGCQQYNQSIISPSSFYFYDEDKKEIIKCDGKSIIPVAFQNNYKNYLTNISGSINNPTNGLGDLDALALGYDSEFRECHFKIKSNSINYNFVISDIDGSLVSEINHESTLGSSIYFNNYLPYKGKLYGLKLDSYTDSLYLLNSGSYQAYNLGFVVNDSASENKVFDVSEILTDSSVAFTNHVIQGSVGDEQTVTENRIREGVHKIALRGSGDRVRGSWMKHTISYSSLGEKFNIFAVNTKIRKSR